MKEVPNERKMIYAIYNFIVASRCLLFSHCSHLNTTTNLNGIFGDVNFSVNGNNGNRETLLKMYVHFKRDQHVLENQNYNLF